MSSLFSYCFVSSQDVPYSQVKGTALATFPYALGNVADSEPLSCKSGGFVCLLSNAKK